MTEDSTNPPNLFKWTYRLKCNDLLLNAVIKSGAFRTSKNRLKRFCWLGWWRMSNIC